MENEFEIAYGMIWLMRQSFSEIQRMGILLRHFSYLDGDDDYE